MPQNKNRCLTQFRLLYSELNTMDLVTKKKQTVIYFSQFWELRSLRSRHQLILVRSCFLVCRWPSSGCVLTWKEAERQREREKQALPSFYKGSKLHSSGVYPHDLITAKAQCSNTIILGVRISTYEFGGEHKHLNSNLSGQASMR